MNSFLHTHRGISHALGAAILFGISTPLARLAMDSTSPWLIAGILYLGSGVGLALLRRIRRHASGQESPLQRSDLPWLASATLFGGLAAPVLLLFGLLTVPASSASLLLNLEAVATACIAWMVFKESVDRRIGLGFLAILLGAILLSLPADGQFGLSPGALLIIAACICWGVDNNLTRAISGSDPSQIAMWKGLVAGMVNTTIALVLGARLPSPGVCLGTAAVGFFGYGISLLLFVKALRFLGTARTGAYFSTAPFAGAAFALLIGQGKMDGMLATAGLLMLAGVWLHVTERHEHEHVHEFQEHAHLHFHDEHHSHDHSADDPPGEPHAHFHRHRIMRHKHPHYPDLHHRHEH